MNDISNKIEALKKAIHNKGVNPKYHDYVLNLIRHKSPTIWKAISDLIEIDTKSKDDINIWNAPRIPSQAMSLAKRISGAMDVELSKTYQVTTLCKNCGTRAIYNIGYARKILDCVCENCGCYNMEYYDGEATTKHEGKHDMSKKLKE